MADSIEIKPDGSWEFHGEDSRLSRNREDKQVTYRVWNPLTQKFEYQVMDKVYCMNCGSFYGYSARSAPFIKYLCDDCYTKGCPEWFVPMLPEEEVAWRNGLPPPNK